MSYNSLNQREKSKKRDITPLKRYAFKKNIAFGVTLYIGIFYKI